METGKVKIVTDSSSYLDPEISEKYDIRVIPLRIGFGTDSYREGVDITTEEYYKKLESSKDFPTTSQPPIGDFTQVYGELVQSGHQVLSVHISRSLSGTLNTAILAKKEFPEAQIEIVDSLSMPISFFTVRAAKAAEEGKSLADVKAIVDKVAQTSSIVAVLDTLEYIWRGGRIGRAKALLGTLLSVKPIITLHGGEVDALAKVRSKSKGIEYMLDFIGRRVEESTPIRVGVIHTHALDQAMLLKEKLTSRFNCVEVEVIEFGPVLTTNLGPGVVALGFHVAD